MIPTLFALTGFNVSTLPVARTRQVMLQRVPAAAAAALLAFVPVPAAACLGSPQAVSVEDLEQFREVYAVRVTGVELTAYEKFELELRGVTPACEEGDTATASDEAGDPQIPFLCVYPTSSTPDFTVRVLVDWTYAGAPTPLIETTLGGCGAVVPAVGDFGILVRDPGSTRAQAAWFGKTPEHYRELVAHLDGDAPPYPRALEPEVERFRTCIRERLAVAGATAWTPEQFGKAAIDACGFPANDFVNELATLQDLPEGDDAAWEAHRARALESLRAIARDLIAESRAP